MATRVLRTVLHGILLAIPLTAFLGFFPSPALSQDRPINVKMASLAPANSVWHDALMDMGARWREVSGGKVNLQIIPNGQGGEEDDVLRRMRLGQFQAGGFTLAGLQHLSPAVVVLAIPLAIETPGGPSPRPGGGRTRPGRDPPREGVRTPSLGGYGLDAVLHAPTRTPPRTPFGATPYVEWGESSLTALWREARVSAGSQTEHRRHHRRPPDGPAGRPQHGPAGRLRVPLVRLPRLHDRHPLGPSLGRDSD